MPPSRAATLSAAPPDPATFSIAAADPATGEVGVAVASRFFAVGTVVPWAKAGVGAVATQASANTSYGPNGLDLIARGATAEEALRVLLRGDDGRDRRQVGIVTAAGDSATHSGSGCNSWAGGRRGPNYAVQGNILTGEAVVVAMEKSFLGSAGRPLAERLLSALAAGDAAGGDSRGRQSAALLVCRAKGGYNGFTDRAVDVRVDDHADPFRELSRLVGDGRRQRPLEPRLDGVHGEALRRGAEVAGAGDGPRGGRSRPCSPRSSTTSPSSGSPPVTSAGALSAARRALQLNPKLGAQAASDPDLAAIRAELK